MALGTAQDARMEGQDLFREKKQRGTNTRQEKFKGWAKKIFNRIMALGTAQDIRMDDFRGLIFYD
jgi:hypothetical protein